jgi:hypothetical protein
MNKGKQLAIAKLQKKFPEWNEDQILAHYDRLTSDEINPHGESATFPEKDVPTWMHEELR